MALEKLLADAEHEAVAELRRAGILDDAKIAKLKRNGVIRS